MERLTEKTIGCFEYSLKDHKPIVGEFGTYEAFFDYSMAVRLLGKYEDTGLEPEEISKLQQERDYWEREAKKYCAALGEQRIKLQQMECEGIAKDKNGKCLGYCYSETDDEPIDVCKNCELYESYEDAD
jgi:N-methylhydantoinase A/oxoprolinase/acetone carboxylase beta subunit